MWAGPLGLVFDKSTDGGLTFGKDKVIGDMPGGWDFEIEGLNRANGMPVTGVDLSNGPNKGTLYVNWIDARNGDPDVFVMSSRNGGETWTAPVRVNDDALKNGKAQFFTWMAIDPADGSVNIVFYDRREGTGHANWSDARAQCRWWSNVRESQDRCAAVQCERKRVFW